jgi:streptomycin 6-kinase
MKIEIICDTLQEAWMSIRRGALHKAAKKAAELARVIETSWSERTIDLALSFAERRRLAFDPAQSVLVHGDAHQ